MKVKAGQDIEERAVILGRYILEHKATVRAAAKQFGISKSTVHKDITEKLPVICPQMYPAVKEILEINKQERHIRGGMATKHTAEEQKHYIKTARLPLKGIRANILHKEKLHETNHAAFPKGKCFTL